jgi:chlorite dismutase
MKSKKIILAGICLFAMSIMILPAVTSAAYDTQDYTLIDSNVNSDIACQMKPSEIVELYPMSEEEEIWK